MSLKSLTIIVMGVSGCGKSTIAQRLADRLKAPFKDGDEFHSAQNIDRMSQGLPLRETDRLPWLKAINDFTMLQRQSNSVCVIACSALRKTYRDILSQPGSVLFVYLEGSYDLIGARMRERSDHFMPENLLASQFETLEVPDADECAVVVSIDDDMDAVVGNAFFKVCDHPLFQ